MTRTVLLLVLLSAGCVSRPGTDDDDTGSGEDTGTAATGDTWDTADTGTAVVDSGAVQTGDTFVDTDTDAILIDDPDPVPACVAGQTWRSPSVGRMVCIVPGSFLMGSMPDEIGSNPNEVPRNVVLSRPFWIAATELTQRAARRASGNAVGHFEDCGPTCPAETITWWDALALANLASAADGFDACYALYRCSGTVGAGLTCQDFDVLTVQGDVLRCEGYRLPTEAEWEFAARSRGAVTDQMASGGNLVAGNTYDCTVPAVLDDGRLLSEQAWYCGNADFMSHPVAQLRPTPLGMYDVGGNVSEWTWDGYLERPIGLVDPKGALVDVPDRVIKGGNWPALPDGVRPAKRTPVPRTFRSPLIGVRFVRTGSPSPSAGVP